MKTSPPLLLALVAALFVAAPVGGRAATLAAKSTITSVTVYSEGAIVTRTAPLDLAATGVTDVTFDQLPAGLGDSSLQVSGQGSAQATILDITTRVAFQTISPNERVKMIEAQLRALNKDLRGLDDRKKLLEAQRVTIGNTEAALFSPASKDVPRPSVAEITSALTFVNEQRARITTDMAALDDQRADLTAKISATQQQLNEIANDSRRSTKSIVVRLDVATAGKLDLTVSYGIDGAKWTPRYDARANSNEKTVALTYQGVVRQNTGEDWKDVSLTLSTARPSLGGSAPKQSPWGLDVYYPRPAAYPASATTGVGGGLVKLDAFSIGSRAKDTIYGAAAAAPAPVVYDSAPAQAALEQAATSASFKVTAPATVPSDNTDQKVPIATIALNAVPEYATTPKLRPAAFLTSKVVNSSDFPLLAGEMNVFLDGTFVATDKLETVMSGEKFDLALGADEGIAVKHKRVQRFAEDMGLTGRGRRVTYDYLITIQNNKKTAARVVVSDQIPVSRNEKIVVKQLAPDAKENKPTTEGTLKWTLDLKPGEKRELPLKFSVDYPGDVQVAGLEP